MTILYFSQWLQTGSPFQYPAWLDENKSKLEKKDFENYSKQFELMRTIVTEFDSEQSGDSDDVKKRRFDRILDVMQRMQEMGQPPKDLVGDMVSSRTLL